MSENLKFVWNGKEIIKLIIFRMSKYFLQLNFERIFSFSDLTKTKLVISRKSFFKPIIFPAIFCEKTHDKFYPNLLPASLRCVLITYGEFM